MHDHAHKHITCDEIEKYAKLYKECFWDNLNFFEDFDNRLDTCPVCGKRFRMYTMFTTMTREELLEEDIINADDAALRETLIPEWLNKILDKLHGVGEFVSGTFNFIPTPIPSTRGATPTANNKSVFSVSRCGNNDDLENNIIIEENDNFFEFEIYESTTMTFTMSIEKTDNQNYTLFLYHENDGNEYNYPIKAMAKPGLIGARTNKLPIGKYVGIIIRSK